MKKSSSFLFSIILAIVFCVTAINSQASNFGENDWTVTYFPCGGYYEIAILYSDGGGYNSPGVGRGDSYFDWLELKYQNQLGNDVVFFEWWINGSTQFANPGTYNGTDVTHGRTYRYRFPIGGTTWTWVYDDPNQTDNNHHKYIMKVRLYDIPEALLGGSVDISIEGYWQKVCCFNDENNDYLLSNVLASVTKSDQSTRIDPPSGLNATTDVVMDGNVNYCDRVRLSWTNPTNMNFCGNVNWRVEVFRNGGYIGHGGKLGYYNDYTAQKGVTYNYKIRSIFEPNGYIDDYSDFTSEVTGRRVGPLDAIPSVTTSNDRCDGKITVNWDWFASNPKYFQIERSTSPTGPWTTLATDLLSTDRTFDDSPPSEFQDFYYRLRNINHCDDPSDWTASPPGSAVGLPSKVTDVNAVIVPGVGVQLNWPDAQNETGYKIERSQLGGGGSFFFDVGEDVTQFLDESLVQCQTYQYFIRSINDCTSDGIQSDSVAQAILIPDLSNTFLPNSVLGSKGFYSNRVEINWTVENNENFIDEYKIFRKVLGSQDDSTIVETLIAGSNFFVDTYVEAGELYEYFVLGASDCENQTIYTNIASAVGFRSPFGIVTGNVTYSGGVAVDSVQISAETTSGISGKSLSFNGTGNLRIDDKASLDLTDEFLFECWIKPTDYSSDFTLFEKQGSYSLKHNATTQTYDLSIWYNGAQTTTLSVLESDVPLNNYNHLAAQIFNGRMMIIRNGFKLNDVAVLGTIDIDDNNSDLIIGAGFTGILDEIRIWNQSKDLGVIDLDYSRLMTGSETGLQVYLRANENKGEYAYDLSKEGTTFHRNHGLLEGNVAWSSDIPSESELGVVAYTDSIGNYLLNIPYNGIGEAFVLIPSFQTHTFDPSSRSLFIGDGSSVYGNIDFLDESSFLVEGFLHYPMWNNNTPPCPVKDAFLKVDGQIVVVDGAPVKTKADGSWAIQVPIGEHFVSVEQPGHIYSVGRFPATDKYDFQEDLAGIMFTDSTFVKVIGRMVGGLREAQYLPGFGKSKNNIGAGRIWLASLQNLGCYQNFSYTDSLTGEYTTYVPPLKYLVNEAKVLNLNSTIDFENIPLLDLTSATVLQTRFDTIFDTGGNALGVDSVTFNKHQDYIYRVPPKIVVTDKDGFSDFIGDTTYTYPFPGTNVLTTRNLRNEPFRWPVFTQDHSNENFLYRALIKVYEEYSNFDSGTEVQDSVPTTDGMLHFNNELSILNQVNSDTLIDVKIDIGDVNTLDTLKAIVYSFKPGFPNFIENNSIPEYSYTRKFEINLLTGTGNDASWRPVAQQDIPLGGDDIYRAYMLGTRSNGQQFVTFGPQIPEYILRDPPGSNSSASRSTGSTKTESSTWDWNLGGAAHTKDGVFVGADFSVGLGVQTKTVIKGNIIAGFQAEIAGGRSGEQVITTSNTQSWSTNSGTDIESEASSDVYVGKSKNVQFGIAEELSIIPDPTCNQVECIGGNGTEPGAGFSFGKKYGLSIVPLGYQTQFTFSQFDIENFKIPQLLHLRDVLLQSNPKFTSHLPLGHDNYGKNNDDPVFGANVSTTTPDIAEIPEDFTGPSYTFVPDGTLQDSLSGDSVRILNNQVKHWIEAIKLNEWEKVNIGNQTVIDSLKQNELDSLQAKYQSAIDAHTALIVLQGLGGVVIPFGLISTPVPGTSFAGFATFALTTATGIGLAELEEEVQTYNLLKQRIEEKFEQIGTPANYTITGGNTFSSSMTHETAASHTSTVEYKLHADFVIEAAGKVNGNGVKLEKGMAVDYTSGRSWTTASSNTETVDWTYSDPDIGDEVSFDVFPSILGWGPIFKKKAGGSTACPYEGEIVTTYYEPGTTISEPSLQAEVPTISASPTLLTNIPVDQPAVFNLTLGNDSESGMGQTYTVSLSSPSNPFGAIVKVDGAVLGSRDIPLPVAGTAINKLLTVEKGPGPVYHYDSLLVLFHSSCQFTNNTGFIEEIVDSAYISAHFLPTCTEISLSNPETQWVLNSSFNDSLEVVISDYNINFFDLENIRFDFKPSSQPNWVPLQTFHKDTTGLNDSEAVEIPDGLPSTFYPWVVDQYPDGEYDLRAVSNCVLAQKNSITYSGIMDRVNPHAFGSPSPADGILSPNDEISIKFNETIEEGVINPAFNFDIRGVTNGSEVPHNTSVKFDGASSLDVNGGVLLQKRDFTIDFVVRRNTTTGNQVIMSQGSDINNEWMVIGFDAAGHLVFRINNETVSSDATFTDNDWHYFAASYNYESETVELFHADANTTATLINSGSTTIFSDVETTGAFIFGKNGQGNNLFFNGNLHDVRIWNYAKSLNEWSELKSRRLSGSEQGLLHNWRMDEGEGNLAIDHVRRRDATGSPIEWEISPSGSAAEFDGSDDYLKVFTGDVNITPGMDFTLEFWFKSAQAGEATLFSNGTGTGLASDSLYSWNIVKDALGRIHIKHKGNDFVVSETNFFDDNWNHFALVFRRNANLSAYVNGELQNATSSLPYAQLAGSHMFLGARGFKTGLVDSISSYYHGMLDEFRFWNTARTVFQVNRDKSFRLNEDELGLSIYLPFEDYFLDPTGIPILTPTFDEQTDPLHVVQAANGLLLTSQSPNIKLPRPVQSIAFDYAVNNDEIILTPTTSPEIIENVTLDITVTGIRDLHGNIMESPETWIAYIDKNQVVWQDDNFVLEMIRGDELSFNSNILNEGGSQMPFEITNIPPWLAVTPSSGLINPNSSVPVLFEIDPEVAIGNYEEGINLLTSFNFPERLSLDLKVREEEPDWTVDPNDFEHSMNIIGQLKIREIISTDDEDILMVRVGGEVRGVAKLEYVDSPVDAYLAFLSIYSNVSSGEDLEFQIWDASSGTVYSDVLPDFVPFVENSTLGHILNPQIFEETGEIQVEVDVYDGWNWLGFFLEMDDPTNLDDNLGSLSSQDGDQIKGQNSFSNFSTTLGWNGSLNAVGLQPESLYKFKSSADDLLIQKGNVLDPTTIDINLVTGWNWIGYVSIRNQGVDQALGGLNAVNGDLIKSKSQFAVYQDGLGWVGNLNTLIPGQGFMFKSFGNKVFNYPLAGMFKSNSEKPKYFSTDFWEVDHAQFATNMTMIGGLNNNCNVTLADTKYALGLFDEDHLVRALSPIQFVEEAELSFLTIAGNNGDDLSVALLNTETGEEIYLGESFDYESNRHIGELENPFVFNISDEVCLKLEAASGMHNELFTAFPSVFVNGLTLDFVAEREDEHARIKMFDIYGQLVFETQIVLNEGYNRNQLNFAGLNLASGVYMIELYTNNSSQSVKVIKAK